MIDQVAETVQKPRRRGRRAKPAQKRHRQPEETNGQEKPLQKPIRPIQSKEQAQAIPRPISKRKLISSKGLDKIRIVRLLLAGASPKDISSKIDIGVTQCLNLIKEIEQDITDLTWQDYLSLLLGKLRLFMDNHTQNSADIQLMLLDVDIAIKGTQEAIGGETDKRIKLSLQSRLDRLRSDRLTLMRELNANNTALTTNLSKMGVTNVPTSSKNKVPTQPSIGGEIPNIESLPASYRDMGRDALLEAMGDSNRDVGRYLRAEAARKKALERDSEQY